MSSFNIQISAAALCRAMPYSNLASLKPETEAFIDSVLKDTDKEELSTRGMLHGNLDNAILWASYHLSKTEDKRLIPFIDKVLTPRYLFNEEETVIRLVEELGQAASEQNKNEIVQIITRVKEDKSYDDVNYLRIRAALALAEIGGPIDDDLLRKAKETMKEMIEANNRGEDYTVGDDTYPNEILERIEAVLS